MVVEKENKPIGKIQELKQFLPEKTQEELNGILAYGKEIKAEGEKKKKEFWSKYNREDFEKLLGYMFKNKEDLESKYKYLDKMNSLEKSKFVDEYLYDDMLYSGMVIGDEKDCENFEGGVLYIQNGNLSFNGKVFGTDWIEILNTQKFEVSECMELEFFTESVGDEGAEAIAKNLELKKGVKLDLYYNEIGPEGAKAIATNMKLQDGVFIDLGENKLGYKGVQAISMMKMCCGVGFDLDGNDIGAKGAEAISQMELQEGMQLILSGNQIGDEGVRVIAENMKLKEGVTLSLNKNFIGKEGFEAISKMELKEGVTLHLSENKIGDECVELLLGMKLKEGVKISLKENNISQEKREEIRAWVQSYNDSGIDCKVILE